MVNVELAAAVPEIVTEVGENLQLIGVVAPEGGVTLHCKVTGPVNPLDGVTLIVVVSPVVAPPFRLNDEGLLLKAKPPVVEVPVTVTSTVVVCVMDPDLPVTFTTYAPAVVEVVVPMDNVEVTPAVPVIFTEVGEMLQLIGVVAPVGTVVTLHCSVTVPVNPFEGVAVIVDVSPVVAPPCIETLPLLLNAKVGVVDTAPPTAAEMPSV
jgi:hypothetical protein